MNPGKPGKLNTALPIVNRHVCHHCGACVAACGEEALYLWDGWLEVRAESCTGCRRCIPACPLQALRLEGPLGAAV